MVRRAAARDEDGNENVDDGEGGESESETEENEQRPWSDSVRFLKVDEVVRLKT